MALASVLARGFMSRASGDPKGRPLTLFCVVLLTLLICSALAAATYYINYWPSDSQNPYVPTAAKLFQLHYISDIHNLPLPGILRINMHGKEALILGIAIMQKILRDPVSLYPNVLLLITAVGICAILIYLIVSRLLDASIGLIVYLFFIFCFWPYIYVLLGAHQPLSLMNFLFAVFFLLSAAGRRFLYFLSGAFLALMLFSSPTAPLYLPYYLGFLICQALNSQGPKKLSQKSSFDILFILSGFLIVFLLFTLPDPWQSVKDFLRFVHFSQHNNNFAIYHIYLERFFPLSIDFRGAGWLWILKYFFLIMPVLFTLYWLSAIYLLKIAPQKKYIFLIFILSVSTPCLVEIIKVVQFGRNYFPSIVGILGLIGFSLYEIKHRLATRLGKRIFWIGITSILALHISFNLSMFLNDIYPSRTVTTHIYNWCRKNNIDQLFVYYEHPLKKNLVQFFNNPKYKTKMKFFGIHHIAEASDGYILIPPITGKTSYVECRYDNFAEDPYATELFLSGNFQKYVVASFKTAAASRIWNMEEEICAYRDLILGQVSPEDRKKGYAYILDAKKLHTEWFSRKTLPEK